MTISRRTFSGLLASAASFPFITSAARAQQRKFYSFGSFHSGSSQYVYVGTLIGLARQHLPSISLSNEAGGGTTQNLDLMRRREMALGIATPERLHAAHHGTGSYQDKQVPVTIMWVMNNQAVLLFTKAESPIRSLRDLKGKRVVIGPAGSSNEIKNAFLLEAYGYKRKPGTKSDFEDISVVRLSYPEAANAIAEGAVDATIATQPVPDSSFAELAFRIPIRVVPVDMEMFEKVTSVYRWLWPVRIPAGSYRGQDRDLTTLGDPNYVIAQRELLPEDVAYDLTKTYVEKVLPEMAKQTDYLKSYVNDRQELVSSWAIPGHPGAVRYFREIGLKVEEPKA
ncbi:MAG: TAXI family TRAP transporter solute-binding subunit [Pseudorhodoplanes sp.]|nr:TAXI family TRAP transporter solute-binding subunit [Pseudorhodoplanes sp.]